MFDIGPGEFAVLVIVGILVVGPERLPGMLRQAMTVVRNLRGQVATAKEQLTASIGPQVGEMVDLVGDLNPRRLLEDKPSRQPASAPVSPRTALDADLPDAPIVDADTP